MANVTVTLNLKRTIDDVSGEVAQPVQVVSIVPDTTTDTAAAVNKDVAETVSPYGELFEDARIKKSAIDSAGTFKKFQRSLASIIKMVGDVDSDNLYDDPPTAKEVKLAIRDFNGEIHCPKKKKRRENSNYQTVKDLLASPHKAFVCHFVHIALAWSAMIDFCNDRAKAASESTYWDDCANEERADMWDSRATTMDDMTDEIETAIEYFKEEAWEDFVTAVANIPEIDCE